MKLVEVDPSNDEHIIMLREYLSSRLIEPHSNISHRSMPTAREHAAFVRSRPYDAWWLIRHRKAWVGATYVTKAREIGIYILPFARSAGVGSKVVAEVRRRFPGPILANVNPENVKARQFWERMGGKLLQVTYAL